MMTTIICPNDTSCISDKARELRPHHPCILTVLLLLKQPTKLRNKLTAEFQPIIKVTGDRVWICEKGTHFNLPSLVWKDFFLFSNAVLQHTYDTIQVAKQLYKK